MASFDPQLAARMLAETSNAKNTLRPEIGTTTESSTHYGRNVAATKQSQIATYVSEGRRNPCTLVTSFHCRTCLKNDSRFGCEMGAARGTQRITAIGTRTRTAHHGQATSNIKVALPSSMNLAYPGATRLDQCGCIELLSVLSIWPLNNKFCT